MGSGPGPLPALGGAPRRKHQRPHRPPRCFFSKSAFPFTLAAWQSRDLDLGPRDAPPAGPPRSAGALALPASLASRQGRGSLGLASVPRLSFWLGLVKGSVCLVN